MKGICVDVLGDWGNNCDGSIINSVLYLMLEGPTVTGIMSWCVYKERLLQFWVVPFGWWVGSRFMRYPRYEINIERFENNRDRGSGRGVNCMGLIRVTRVVC